MRTRLVIRAGAGAAAFAAAGEVIEDRLGNAQAPPGGKRQPEDLPTLDAFFGFPHAVEMSAEGRPSAHLTYDGVETNAPLDAGLFAPPPALRVLPLDAIPAAESS